MTERDETYWFKPRRYGYGARPVTWQGWAASLAYLLAMVLLLWFFPAPKAQTATFTDIALWIGTVALVTLSFVGFARQDRWRVAVALGRARVRDNSRARRPQTN